MGILNLTPDSFSDGGRFLAPGAALAHALHMLDQGADLLDLGGESTRPSSVPITPEQEQARVLPVLRDHAVVGARITFAGCAQAPDDPRDAAAPLALVPVRAEIR